MWEMKYVLIQVLFEVKNEDKVGLAVASLYNNPFEEREDSMMSTK